METTPSEFMRTALSKRRYRNPLHTGKDIAGNSTFPTMRGSARWMGGVPRHDALGSGHRHGSLVTQKPPRHVEASDGD